MCKCDPRVRTPFCGKVGCQWPKATPSKNKKFKRQYIITVEGVTTNNHASDFIEKGLLAVVQVLNGWFKQVSVKAVEKDLH